MNYQLDVCTAGNFSLHLTDCEIKYNLGYNSNFSFIDSFSLNRMDLTQWEKAHLWTRVRIPLRPGFFNACCFSQNQV